MGALKDIFSSLMLDATPEERAKTLRLMFRIIVSVHIAWACGLLAPWGLSGFVFAGEVDDKIQSAVEPIRSELGQVAAKVARTEEISKRILVGQIASQLRDLNRLRCTTSDEHVRMRMERDIEEGEQEYKHLTGERYPLAACKDL
jgi:hypothetical protein